MVQKERRPSQVVTIGYQQSGHQGGHQSGYQTGYQNGYPIVYQSGHQKVTNNIPTSVTSAKKSVVYRVPIQLEWQPSKVSKKWFFFLILFYFLQYCHQILDFLSAKWISPCTKVGGVFKIQCIVLSIGV